MILLFVVSVFSSVSFSFKLKFKKSRFIEIFKLMSCVALPITQCKDGMREVIIKSLGP